MALFVLLFFLADFSKAQLPLLIPYRFGLHDIKGAETRSNESSSAILSDVDDRDTFCRENVNAIFPDPYAYNIYYRCRRNGRETWKCIGNLYFDPNSQKCSQLPLSDSDVPAESCRHKQDGFYPLYNTNCQNYVRCKGGTTAEERQCWGNHIFSYASQSCRIKSEAKCIEAHCPPNGDGFFIHPGTDCRAYYICRKGVRIDFLCPRGQTFDLSKQICVDGGICYEPICVGRVDGTYPDTTHGCRRFFRCQGGEVQDMTGCPDALRYNGLACVEDSSVVCEKPETTAAAIYNRRDDKCKFLRDGNHIVPGTDCKKIRTCVGGRTVGTSECPENYRYNGAQCYHRDVTVCEDACTDKSDGYHADHGKGCREYFRCYDGQVTDRGKCQNGTLFDGKLCSPSQLIDCNNPDKANGNLCIGLRDGLHPDYVNGCRGYLYCHDQQVIMMNACPGEMRWNGSQCVDRIEFRCDSKKILPQCNGVLTGLYQDVSSNCTHYIYCNNGQGTLLSCPAGEVHDGNRCRSASEYTCPSAVRDECYNQPDGYRQDEKSSCRAYFFCSKGSKITYVCAPGLIFNGTQCVSPKLYTCPYRGNDCNGRYDGYYPDQSTGCSKYFYCLNEKRITTLACGGKKIFTGNSCTLPETDAKSMCGKEVSNPCRRRKDGKYSDPKSRCDRYIRCQGHSVVEEGICPRGTGFDGTQCSSQQQCNVKNFKPPCDGYRMSFVPDYSSGCKSYYFCIGGLRMLATCPDGTIFNGRVCQDDRTYKCPIDGVGG